MSPFRPSANYSQEQYDANVAWWAAQRAKNQPAYDTRIAAWRKETAASEFNAKADRIPQKDFDYRALLSLPA